MSEYETYHRKKLDMKRETESIFEEGQHEVTLFCRVVHKYCVERVLQLPNSSNEGNSWCAHQASAFICLFELWQSLDSGRYLLKVIQTATGVVEI